MNEDEEGRKEREGGRRGGKKKNHVQPQSLEVRNVSTLTSWVICNVLHTLVTCLFLFNIFLWEAV